MNKKFILSLVFWSFFYTLSAQKSLNIDSVFTISMEIQTLIPTRTFTVPVNKIWKIETLGNTCVNQGAGRIELNSRRTDLWGTSKSPIWLGSGDVLGFIHTGGGQCWAYLSVIQFTLN
jgi:hypothetical protein